MIATATTNVTAVAPHNCWDPRTWKHPAASQQKTTSSGLTDLNNPLVQKLVKQQVESFFRGVAAPIRAKAPSHASRHPSIDVTPKFLMGAHYQAYNVNGELMVKVTSVTRSPSHSTWYDLGRVPAADVVNPMARDSFTPASAR